MPVEDIDILLKNIKQWLRPYHEKRILIKTLYKNLRHLCVCACTCAAECNYASNLIRCTAERIVTLKKYDSNSIADAQWVLVGKVPLNNDIFNKRLQFVSMITQKYQLLLHQWTEYWVINCTKIVPWKRKAWGVWRWRCILFHFFILYQSTHRHCCLKSSET